MSFLTVLFAYLLSRYTHGAGTLQYDVLFHRLLAWLAHRFPNTPLTFVLSVPVVSVLGGAIIWVLPYGLAFLASLAVVFCSIGRHHCRPSLQETVQALHDNKEERVWLQLQDTGLLTPDEPLWNGICRQTVYEYLNGLFAALFWFCLLGPTGILFYRLLDLYNQRATPLSLPDRRFWQDALDWLPARFMGLCFCLAGDFARGINLWRALFFDTRLAPAVFLHRCADAASVSDNATVTPITDVSDQTEIQGVYERSSALQALLERTEIIGIVGLALVVLL